MIKSNIKTFGQVYSSSGSLFNYVHLYSSCLFNYEYIIYLLVAFLCRNYSTTQYQKYLAYHLVFILIDIRFYFYILIALFYLFLL